MSILDLNVEEEVMKIMIVKMKASFSPSAVYSRMKIGALDHTLEITERNILRIRKESVFFRICWEELLGCYDTVKPYMDYTPEGPGIVTITIDEDEPVKAKRAKTETGSIAK